MKHQPPMGGVRGIFLRWSPADSLLAAEGTLDKLKSWGVQVAPGNRLESARDLLRRAGLFNVQYDQRNRDTEIAVAEAHKTVFETFLIVTDLQRPDRQTKKKLRIMLKGPAVPSDTGDDPGRDTQAEFVAGAIFRAAGYYVGAGEPDLLLSKGGARKWGVAVKRPKSDRAFQKRVREAQRQLAKHGLYGFIVVNPELFLARLQHLEPEAVSQTLFDKTGDWVDYLEGYDSGSRVLAVVALATSFRLVRDDGYSFQFGLHIHQRYVTNGDPKEMQAIKAIGDATHAALRQSFSSMRPSTSTRG